MRADIHDGPEHMLQTETEYIDARPHQPASTKSLLHRAAGPYIRVKNTNRQMVVARSARVETLAAIVNGSLRAACAAGA
jgi:hypothetical protein